MLTVSRHRRTDPAVSIIVPILPGRSLGSLVQKRWQVVALLLLEMPRGDHLPGY